MVTKRSAAGKAPESIFVLRIDLANIRPAV